MFLPEGIRLSTEGTRACCVPPDRYSGRFSVQPAARQALTTRHIARERGNTASACIAHKPGAIPEGTTDWAGVTLDVWAYYA